MKALVFHMVGDVRLEEVTEPAIQQPTDAIVRLSASAICGTDLHMVRGTVGNMKEGTILGHEGVGIVEETGHAVRNFKPGDRVVIASTIACGYCAYCRQGYYSQCDIANPNGPKAGTAYFGGSADSGPFHGLQAEKVRVPYANVGLVKLPKEISDEQAISLSDVFPTGYFGAILAEIKRGDNVAVFGCGPVGLFAIASAFHLGAGRVIAVDSLPYRLVAAKALGAEVVDFNAEDPIKVIQELTGGIGVDRAIDAVGIDAMHAEFGPASKGVNEKQFQQELRYVVKNRNPSGENWQPGNAPSEALRWAVEALDKAGSLSVIGVYPETLMVFPIGQAMSKNLTIKMGNCNHRQYIPHLIELIRSGVIDPAKISSHRERFTDIIEAYKAFDARKSGWIKVMLEFSDKAKAA